MADLIQVESNGSEDAIVLSEEGEVESSDEESIELISESDEEIDPERVSEDALERLGSSESLKQLLCNHHLRSMITELDQSDNPVVLLQKAMQVPIFVEFADKCLEICGLRDGENYETLY